MSPRIVLITGANSGVGLAAAKVLTSASKNYHVIMASRSLAKIEAAKSEVEKENPDSASRISTVQLDVTDTASITKAHDFVEKNFGHLDALVNNAAVGVLSNETLQSRMKEAMDVNVTGPVLVSEAFRPLLFKSSNPYSIFVSSGIGSFARAMERINGRIEKTPGLKGGEGYAPSKAALNMIALGEHSKFAEEGLKVFAMCPGFVVSNLRGPSEEMRTGWGKAGPASVSGEIILSILDGDRDKDVGKFVWKDGVYDW